MRRKLEVSGNAGTARDPLRMPALVYEDGELVQPGPPHPGDFETARFVPLRWQDRIALAAAVIWLVAEFPAIFRRIVG